MDTPKEEVDGRGGARPGAGSEPNIERTLAKLSEQIAWYEKAPTRRSVDFTLLAVQINVLKVRLVALGDADAVSSELE